MLDGLVWVRLIVGFRLVIIVKLNLRVFKWKESGDLIKSGLYLVVFILFNNLGFLGMICEKLISG